MAADQKSASTRADKSDNTPARRPRRQSGSAAGTGPSSRKVGAKKPLPKTRRNAGAGSNSKAPIRAIQKQLVTKVVRRLKADYPDATCALHYDSAFQLLVATILSAQCTDERVNMVTDVLFRRYPTAADLARVPLKTLTKAVQSTGFFRNKAKNIKACSQELVDKYDGQVPRDLDQLVSLPGIGRKTANVVLGTAFGVATGVVVDTHVGRLSRRLGLSHDTDPEKVERTLMEILPKKEWIDFSHRMIYHGRRVCMARKPLCDCCSMTKFCPRNGV